MGVVLGADVCEKWTFWDDFYDIILKTAFMVSNDLPGCLT